MTGITTGPIESKLVHAWKRERRFFHARGVAHLVFWVVGLFLASLAVDWLFRLPAAVRLILLATNLGALAFAAWRYWLQYLRQYDASRIALQVERLHPGLNNLVVSYVQLNGAARGPLHGSPQMIAAMRQQAVQGISNLSFQRIVDFSTLRNLLIASATVLVLFLASSVIAAEIYGIFVVRMLNPFTEASYPTRTRIEKTSVDQVASVGEDVECWARAAGEVPENGLLHVNFANSGWERIDLARGAQGTFAQKLPKVTRDFAYYFHIGDAQSKPYQVTVVPPPRIVEARVKIRYPKYTLRTDEQRPTLQLPAVIEGTQVVWELRIDQPLKSAQLQVMQEKGASLPLEIDRSDPHWCRLTVDDIGTLLPVAGGQKGSTVFYQFLWQEAKYGRIFRDGTRYAVEVIADQPPLVTLLYPRPTSEQERIPITVQKLLKLTFDASDDFGLSRAWISYRVNNDPQPYKRGVGQFKGSPKADTFQTVWTIQESIPGLQVGDTLACEIEAADNRDTGAGPNLGRSGSVRLEVVSEEAYQRYVEKQRSTGLDRTRAALREEIESGKKVKTLLEQ